MQFLEEGDQTVVRKSQNIRISARNFLLKLRYFNKRLDNFETDGLIS